MDRSAGFILYGSFLSAPTYKAGLMLSLCGLPFVYRHLDLSKGMQKTPKFLAINRFGQVPALVHGQTRICQSNVILSYLSEVTGQFAGRDPAERWRALEWLAWEADRLHPAVGRTRFFVRFAQPAPAIADYFRKAAEVALGTLDQNLAAGRFLVGTEPTIADIGCYAAIAYAAEGNLDIARWPNVQAWSDRMAALPGSKVPYELLPRADAA